MADAKGTVLINELAGFGARTRPAKNTHRLSPRLGYGALSCVATEDATTPYRTMF